MLLGNSNASSLSILNEFQAALVKDPGVSVNRVIWSPDGSLFGEFGGICYFRPNLM